MPYGLGVYAIPSVRLLSLFAMVVSLHTTSMAQQDVDFGREVRPLLSRRCFACHGPDARARKAELRLDRPDGEQGAYRERDGVRPLVPGDPDASEVWRRIATADDDDRMPPEKAHQEPMAKAELAMIRSWIASGARYEQHWAFVTPEPPTVPEVDDVVWGEHAVDRFVMARLQREGLAPKQQADRRTLIRRVTFDLTGLPPTRAEIREFLADGDAGAYERLIDRLLQRPQFGEHMARYWLDAVRFADTNGMHHDHYREMSLYRDWVIRAFADGLPFDVFLRHQLAGDLFEEPNEDQLIASGFHRLHLIIDVGTALPEESHARNVIDRVSTFGTVFLGLTVGCAQCHDHKFDPIEQRDFYRLAAFFDNLDAKPETGPRQGTDFQRGLQPPYVELPSREQREQRRELTARLERARAVESCSLINELLAPTPLSSACHRVVDRAKALTKTANEQLDDLTVRIPAAMVMKERAEVRATHVFVRGQYDQLGEQVTRGTPAFLPPLRARGHRPSRMDLADWLLDPTHPLTARVAVNRFWQQFFGVGLVRTSEDFGAQGQPPSHPALLDHLATEFVTSGWNVKALVRAIVTSRTYRQSSAAATEQFLRDPDNRLLSRGARFCLDAEMLRDQVLMTSGLLNREMFGKSVKPPQPAGLWQMVALPDSYPRVYEADEGPDARRRSVYTFWKRGMPPPQMTIFNAPTREACVVRRERTNTPLQALMLLNEPTYHDAARHLAVAALQQVPDSAPERLAFVYETITSHLPEARVQPLLLQSLAELLEEYEQRPELLEQACAGLQLPGDLRPVEVAAWTILTSAIYNLDVTRHHQ